MLNLFILIIHNLSFFVFIKFLFLFYNMKKLIHLFFICIILFYSNNLLSQDIGIQLDRNLGVIESVFIMHESLLYPLQEILGHLFFLH